MITNQTKAHLLLILTQFCFSGWHIVGSQALNDGADPLMFALYRELTASALMLGIIRYEQHLLKVEKADWSRFFFLGACSFTNVVGTIIALGYLSATRYAILQPSIPVWACLISVALGFERLTVFKSIGILLSVGGAVLIETWSEGDSDDDSSNVLLGTIIVIIQCTAMASITVFQKPLLAKYPSPCVTFVYYGIGSILTVLMAIAWCTRFTVYDFYFNGEKTPWIALAYATIFASLFAYNAISWAGARLSPSVVTVYWTLQPVGTVVLSLIVWGRVVTVPEAVGGLLVCLGLITTVWGRRQEELAGSSSGVDPYRVTLSSDDESPNIPTYGASDGNHAEPLLAGAPNVKSESIPDIVSPGKPKSLKSMFF